MTADPTPDVPAGWVAIPVAEVEALRDGHQFADVLNAADAIVARLPKTPAWTEEDVALVAQALATADGCSTPLPYQRDDAETVLAALHKAGRLKPVEEIGFKQVDEQSCSGNPCTCKNGIGCVTLPYDKW